MRKFLTQEERKRLKKQFRLEKNRRYADRIRIILLLDEGRTPKSIAEYLFLDEETVSDYRKRYENGGLGSLVGDDRSD